MVAMVKNLNRSGETGMQNALGTHNMEQGTLAQEKMALWVKAHINLVCKNEYGLQSREGTKEKT